MSAPDGYKRIPYGLRCHCLGEWVDNGVEFYYCCQRSPGGVILDIEERVRKTFCPTFTVSDDGKPIERIEGRISEADFEALLALLKAGQIWRPSSGS
jgi:hypothetical protein